MGVVPMRLFKWSPDFNPKAESPIVPIWITLKKVPLYLCYVEALFELVKPIGRPLRGDNHTANFSRLDKVRVCVEVDLSKLLLKHICVNALENSFTFNILYEDLPNYCHFCLRLGHLEDNCHVKFLEKKKKKRGQRFMQMQERISMLVEKVSKQCKLLMKKVSLGWCIGRQRSLKLKPSEGIEYFQT